MNLKSWGNPKIKIADPKLLRLNLRGSLKKEGICYDTFNKKFQTNTMIKVLLISYESNQKMIKKISTLISIVKTPKLENRGW